MKKLKILVADSHEVFRMGISFILKNTVDFEVVGEAATCTDVMKKVHQYNPDILIIDFHLNDGCAIEVCKKVNIRYPETKTIMLISLSDENSIFEAISAGAIGLLPKQMKGEELTRAVRMVHEGKSILDPSITSKVIDRVKNNFSSSEKNEVILNPQERRILALIAEGKTNKEIAQILMLSNNTIKNYVSGILSKLNFSNRAEAAAYAVKNNLTKPYPNIVCRSRGGQY
ncbi:LuxR C-terminal-related transcriptional regulator [Phosphitispora sp. TUW77]|uniref:LuxR C-terminal-related transcriptional regulator n=1 Tax=Phosphitispora sp. TUW77 TaxID=3152361 RepID=UPI003AB7E9F1